MSLGRLTRLSLSVLLFKNASENSSPYLEVTGDQMAQHNV